MTLLNHNHRQQPPGRHRHSNWTAVLVAVLVLHQPPFVPLGQLVRAQRPLNANGTAFGVDSPTIRPSLRGFSTFNGYALAAPQFAGGFGPNGNGATGEGNGQQASASMRKITGRQSVNALDVSRPNNGNGGGGDGTNGIGGASAFGPGRGAGGQPPSEGGMDALRRRHKAIGVGGVALDQSMAGTTGVGGAGSNGGGGVYYGQTGHGRKHKLIDLRRNITTQYARDRPNDEATMVMPVYGGYENTKNPMYVLKEMFRNDVSRGCSSGTFTW